MVYINKHGTEERKRNKKIFWCGDFLFLIIAVFGEANNSITSLGILLILEIALALFDIHLKHSEIA